MPFNVHIADNEDAIIQARSGAASRRRPSVFVEFAQGVVLGILFVAAGIAAYWLVSEQMQRFPDIHSFMSHWLS